MLDDRDLEMDEVEEILADCLLRPEADVAAAVEAAARVRPDLGAELRSRYSALGELGIRSATAGPLDDLPESFGDFRLERRLGEGGMGVVYEARQVSAGRRVALKFVRPDQLCFSGVRARFRREIDAAVRLQHPGIVPVHAVGEENGVPYFAMELVDGCTLADVIRALRDRAPGDLSGRDLVDAVRERSSGDVARGGEAEHLAAGTWVEASLRLVRQVADALEHAHARGVLHRDVKPSNIMVTPTGRAMLLDFGLARTDDVSELTLPGSELGSLPYMPPERFTSPESVDERGDVYSLGAVLYELLTLARPYLAPTREATRQRILDARPVRPREHAPAIPWEAETVCLVAIERDPARRYRTAADLARDLTNAFERRPVEARRAGVVLRTRRWIARRPATATALVLAFLVVVVAPVAWALQESRARRRLDVEITRARDRLDLAHAAVTRMLTRVAAADLYETPGMTRVRIDLLEDALRLYDTLLREDPDEHDIRLDAARACRILASLRSAVGEDGRAAENRREAGRHLDIVLEALPRWGAARLESGVAAMHRAHALEALGRKEEALAVVREAIDVLASLDAAQEDLRAALVIEGRLLAPDDPQAATAALERALSLDVATPRTDSASIRLELARIAMGAGRWDDAEHILLEAEEEVDAVLARAPGDPRHRQARASVLANLATLHLRRGDRDAAVEAARGAVALWRAYIRDYGEQLVVCTSLARSLRLLARASAADERRPLLDEAHEILTRVLADREVPALRYFLSQVEHDLRRLDDGGAGDDR